MKFLMTKEHQAAFACLNSICSTQLQLNFNAIKCSLHLIESQWRQEILTSLEWFVDGSKVRAHCVRLHIWCHCQRYSSSCSLAATFLYWIWDMLTRIYCLMTFWRLLQRTNMLLFSVANWIMLIWQLNRILRFSQRMFNVVCQTLQTKEKQAFFFRKTHVYLLFSCFVSCFLLNVMW